MDARTAAAPPGAHPRDHVAATVRLLGHDEAVRWLCRLADERERDTDPPVELLGGASDWPAHWRRTWGLRGLLYVWSDRAAASVAGALGGTHWRSREMACKVCRVRSLDVALLELQRLRDHDPNHRVRTAADRAIVAIARA